jgi:hypothetical protein
VRIGPLELNQAIQFAPFEIKTLLIESVRGAKAAVRMVSLLEAQ